MILDPHPPPAVTMLTYVTGNLFESPAQTLVNTVNTVGVMGKGIALQFKQYFPEMFREYQHLCEEGMLAIGQLHLYRTRHKLILNFPTKQHWRRPSQLGFIETGLRSFVSMYQEAGIHSVAFPPLGCGNGELSWDDVRPLMERHLAPLPIPVFIYPPQQRTATPEHRTPDVIREWLRSDPHSLPWQEVWADFERLLTTPREFATLTKETPFTAELTSVEGEPEPHIRIRAAGKTSLLPKSMVREVWRQLKHHGLATSRQLDARHTAFLFPMMGALPYVGVIQLADEYTKFTFSKAWALQIVPTTPKADQRELVLSR